LDLLYQDLGRQLEWLKAAVENVSRTRGDAERSEREAKEALRRLWWPGLVRRRQQAGRDWAELCAEWERLRGEEAALGAGIRDLTKLRDAWKRLSPITILREIATGEGSQDLPLSASALSAGSGGDRNADPIPPTEPAPAHFSLLAIATDPRAKGLQQWLAAKMAEACLLSRLEHDPLPDPVVELLAAAAARSGDEDEESWWLRRFLLLFFFHWSLRSGPLEEIRDRYPSCPGSMRPALVELFGTWRRLQQELANLAGPPRMRCEEEAYGEYGRLTYASMTDQWEQRVVFSHSARLEIVQAHLLGLGADEQG
jgi:hypothetical protein